MNDETYNGHANFETWQCSLWLNNEQGLYEAIREQAQEYDNLESIYEFSQWLEEFVEEYLESIYPYGDNANLLTDIIGAWISTVDFYEMAESTLEEVLYWRKTNNGDTNSIF